MAKEDQSTGKLPENKPEREAGSEDRHGVGALLRASRLRCGEDLRYVSDMLRIRYLYLEAIEDDRFHDLPGPTYMIGFIRAYADHLGLDSDEVVRRLKAETSDASGMSELDFPVPISDSVVPGGAILLVGIILSIIAYGGWYISSSNDQGISKLTSPVTDRFDKHSAEDEPALPESKDIGTVAPETPDVSKADEPAPMEKTDQPKPDVSTGEAPEPAPEQEDSGQPVSANDIPGSVATTKSEVNNPVDEQPPADEQTNIQAEPNKPVEELAPTAEDAATEQNQVVTESVTEPQTPEPQTNTVEDSTPSSSHPSGDDLPSSQSSSPDNNDSTTATEPAPATSNIPAGRTYGLENDGSRITIRARTDSWIQVRDDIANKLLLTRLLRGGDSYRVPNRDGLKLLTGNAGALDIIVDGASVPPIGETGVVRRGVALDVDSLRQGTAVIK